MQTEAIFQYMFTIGSALGLGISFTVLPSVLLYRFIMRKLAKKGWVM